MFEGGAPFQNIWCLILNGIRKERKLRNGRQFFLGDVNHICLSFPKPDLT